VPLQVQRAHATYASPVRRYRGHAPAYPQSLKIAPLPVRRPPIAVDPISPRDLLRRGRARATGQQSRLTLLAVLSTTSPLRSQNAKQKPPPSRAEPTVQTGSSPGSRSPDWSKALSARHDSGPKRARPRAWVGFSPSARCSLPSARGLFVARGRPSSTPPSVRPQSPAFSFLSPFFPLPASVLALRHGSVETERYRAQHLSLPSGTERNGHIRTTSATWRARLGRGGDDGGGGGGGPSLHSSAHAVGRCCHGSLWLRDVGRRCEWAATTNTEGEARGAPDRQAGPWRSGPRGGRPLEVWAYGEPSRSRRWEGKRSETKVEVEGAKLG
jgi:hypothetical protein